MSHVTLSSFRIHDTPDDLIAVTDACQRLGLIFCPHVKTHQWYGKWVDDYHADDAAYKNGLDPQQYGKCEHMIRLPWSITQEARFGQFPGERPYEIGLVKLPDGTLGIAFDAYQYGKGVPEMLHIIGPGGCKLAAAVARARVERQVAKQKGAFIKRVDDLGGGRTKIVIGIKKGDSL